MKENIEIFKKWIYYQIVESKLVYSSKKDSYMIRYKDKLAYIRFNNNIVEESVHDRYGDNIFYLYYDFNHYPLAISFYKAMMDVLTNDTKQTKYRILLCCSGGMTTSYFKMKMNQYLTLTHAPYYIDACAVSDASLIIDQYDMVLVAPQMVYKIEELHNMYPHKIIEPIDPLIFGSYDCAKLYKTITSLLTQS